MSMQNPLEKLAEAAAACQNSQARALLGRFFDEGTFVEIDRLAMDGDKPAEAASGYGLVGGAPVYAFAQDKACAAGPSAKRRRRRLRRSMSWPPRMARPSSAFSTATAPSW